jgi:hypothetical protein
MDRHRKGYQEEYYIKNKDSIRTRQNNLSKHKRKERVIGTIKWRMTKYGITLDKKQEMRVSQLNRCAICLEEFKSNRDCGVDHNHKTGKVRELLCAKCNLALGLFNDNPILLQRAIDYLNKWL